MELDRYYELRAILQQWRTRLAENIRQRIENSAHRLDRLRRMHEADGTDEEFTLWLDRWCRQAAIQFILRLLFLRVLEDRGLLGVTRLRTTDGQQMWAHLARNLGAASYVQWCCWDAAHLLPDLFGPTEYDLVLPDDELVQRFLDDVWRRPDPDRPGWLRFDFRPLPSPAGERVAESTGDPGFQTRFIGDLYQELDAEIRERYALLQTPHFISQFILEHTLLKRFEEKDFREVTLIDPTCGSGHFLVDAFWLFVERYEAAELGRGAGEQRGRGESHFTFHVSRTPERTLPSRKRAQIARTIIETHLHGCDINPYATALTRFRLILAACDYAQPTSLRDFRDLHFNIVTIDSLIPYENLMVAGVRADTTAARSLGQPETIEQALPVLRKRYDTVVGNPPYITAQDATKRDLYRESYESAYGGFGLAAPFTERFLKLAMDGGYIGLINSNAFARRQFGKKLIENVLPHYNIEAVIDLSGAYIPGHGTPTLILFARNQSPKSNTVIVLSNLKGEPSTPIDPAQGEVWRGVVRGFTAGPGYEDEFVDVATRPRTGIGKHPWQFEGKVSRLFEKLQSHAGCQLSAISDSIGRDACSGQDEVYTLSLDFARRLSMRSFHIKHLIRGEDVRDWAFVEELYTLFPYDDELNPIPFNAKCPEVNYLLAYRDLLADRKMFGKRMGDSRWLEFQEFYTSKRQSVLAISFAFIATHNHAVFVSFLPHHVFNRAASLIKLKKDTNENYSLLVALMNTNITCFCLKQVCFNKGAGEDSVRDRFEYASTNIGQTPIPSNYTDSTPNHHHMLILTQEMIGQTDQLPALNMRKLFEKSSEAYHVWNSTLGGYVPPHSELPPPFTSARELRAARDKLIALRQDIRGRMIFLQEEMDWLAYEMYGLLKGKAPLAEDYLSQRHYEAAQLELGQRPFEVAGKGYQGDWPQGYQPAPLPDYLRPLTEERIALIKANPDIALLEDPLYKRRWVPPNYKQEFRAAAEWWLAEKLEYTLEKAGRPLSLKEWARLLSRDERVNATLEVMAGSAMFDREQMLLAIIRANAVPNRPEHYLKPAGLRKLYAARTPHPAEAQTGSGAEESAPPVPEYSRPDFSDGTAWRLRGKLNISRERFISYAEFDHAQRGLEAPDSGGPWFGWAGWDAAQRADALAALLDQANRSGWDLHYRQCGLRAALRDLLPDLAHLPAADQAEFQALAGTCGISLETPCYCQAYRDGIVQGQPGVPGVGAEVLEVKVLPSGERKSMGKSRQQKKEEPGQLRMEL